MHKILYPIIFSLVAASCTTVNASSKPKVPEVKIKSKQYVKASWYNCCKKTANGEKFNPYGMTVAHRTHKFNTKLRLTNPSNNKSIIVRVNDRGPFIKGVGLDVTEGGAKQLGFKTAGRALLRVEVIE